MLILKLILLALGLTFSVFGYLIVFKKKFGLINDFEARKKVGSQTDADAIRVGKIGTVSDYYNQIHRHNVNHYFLCLVTSFGKTEMTSKELEEFELSTLKLTYEEAFEEYKRCAAKPWGVLLANRELPVLEWANQWYSIKE